MLYSIHCIIHTNRQRSLKFAVVLLQNILDFEFEHMCHHRKAPKRKSSKREQTSKSTSPTGMAAGILRVRKGETEVLCDVVTLEGTKQSKTIKQLKAIYDIKRPIKVRVRKRGLRRGRTLRILL